MGFFDLFALGSDPDQELEDKADEIWADISTLKNNLLRSELHRKALMQESEACAEALENALQRNKDLKKERDILSIQAGQLRAARASYAKEFPSQNGKPDTNNILTNIRKLKKERDEAWSAGHDALEEDIADALGEHDTLPVPTPIVNSVKRIMRINKFRRDAIQDLMNRVSELREKHCELVTLQTKSTSLKIPDGPVIREGFKGPPKKNTSDTQPQSKHKVPGLQIVPGEYKAPPPPHIKSFAEQDRARLGFEVAELTKKYQELEIIHIEVKDKLKDEQASHHHAGKALQTYMELTARKIKHLEDKLKKVKVDLDNVIYAARNIKHSIFQEE